MEFNLRFVRTEADLDNAVMWFGAEYAQRMKEACDKFPDDDQAARTAFLALVTEFEEKGDPRINTFGNCRAAKMGDVPGL